MSGKVVMIAMLAGAAGATLAKLPKTPDNGDFAMVSAETKAICKRVGAPSIPTVDKLSIAEREMLRGCDSERLYYGIGIKPDYAKARRCAIDQAGHGDDQVFGGSTILMEIYANGHGVPRNPDLATAFACHVDAAPLEIELRVSALHNPKREAGNFDICSFVSSGLLGGYCASHAARLAAVGRDNRLSALIAGFSPAGRAAWPLLLKSFDVYVEASAGGETDMSGTLRGAFVVEAEEGMRDQQLKDLARLRHNRWPVATTADDKDADDRLNASYRKSLSWAAGSGNLTTIKPDAIRAAQRAWLEYRDSYLRFAAAASPTVSRNSILVRLTRLRVADLDALRSE